MRYSISRTLSALVAVATAVTLVAPHASAQVRRASTGTGFGVGYTDVGPAIGLGGIGNANLSFGGRFEHGFKALPDLGNGTLGIEASFDYYSWSSNFYTNRYVPLGVTANYHFKLEEPRLDPFLGLGLGFRILNCSYNGGGPNLCPSNNDVYFIGRAGMRYFFQPNVAGYVDLGAGASTLNIGLMFKLM